MFNEGVSKLTEKEREALRLVHRRLTSKEIAPLLGIRVDAVDARIKSATRKIGIPDRGKAALILAENEGGEPYQQQVYQSPDIVADADPAKMNTQAAGSLREERAPFEIDPALAGGITVPPLSEENVRVQLSSWQRILIIVGVALGTIVALGVLISALNGLVQLALTRGDLF